MLKLRRLDPSGLRAYLDELRPRVLVVRVRAKGFRFAWAVPMAPFELLLGFALSSALLASPLLRWLPGEAGDRYAGALDRAGWASHAYAAGGRGGRERTAPPEGLMARLSLVAAGGLGEALRLPPGVPYLSVEADDVAIDVRPY